MPGPDVDGPELLDGEILDHRCRTSQGPDRAKSGLQQGLDPIREGGGGWDSLHPEHVVAPRDQVIAGQGTMGLEIAQQVPQVDVVVVPIGGGGMISGMFPWPWVT